MKRQWEIDALRGLMLVLITITHLPTRLTQPVGQPFGFVSAAEGFVLLSAYMAGLVYSRLAARSGDAAMRRAFLKRALKIYLCQAAVLVFLFTVIAAAGVRFDEPAVENLMRYYLQHPHAAVVAGLALVYQPPLLDILPMYVFFMLGSPWILTFALRRGWSGLIGVSALLWLLAQLGLSHWFYERVVLLTGLGVPFQEMGAFNTFAWQALWMAGLYLGASRSRADAPPMRLAPVVVVAACAVALAGFVWRHAGPYGQVPFSAVHPLWNLLFDKWQLGPLRLANLLALGIVFVCFGPALAHRLPRLRGLEAMGSASLAVFCAHLVAVLLTLAWFGGDPYARPWWGDVLLLVAVFGALQLVARVSAPLNLKLADPSLPMPLGPEGVARSPSATTHSRRD
ncbi:MAG: OpgC domain-containing protein [Variovorax sp.]